MSTARIAPPEGGLSVFDHVMRDKAGFVDLAIHKFRRRDPDPTPPPEPSAV